MNLSLRGRITASFVIANAVVLLLGFIVFFFLDSLNTRVVEVTQDSQKIAVLNDEIRGSAVTILKMQKEILTSQVSEDELKKLQANCQELQTHLQRLNSYYTQTEAKALIAKMLGYIESLETVVSKNASFYRDSAGLSTISELTDKILDSFSEFQDMQYFKNEENDKQVKAIIAETRRNMLITLIITFLGTILLSLVIPGKIALPFKKLTDAIRELQDCNFDVSIYYNQKDEIGELAVEINKMISSIKKFEELRTDRISIEHRKFDTLANMSRKNILIANNDSELVYMNNSMYSLLDLQSDDVLHKKFEDLIIPESIIETFELAIKRRSKIENAQISIMKKTKVLDEETNEYIYKEDGEPYHGFANVIPIRAKDSNSDYYMMIISTEVFA